MDIAYCEKKKPELGFLGFGKSKDDAVKAFAEAGLLIDEAKAAALNYKQAAGAANFWAEFMPVEAQYYKDRDYVSESSRGITLWGDYVKKANEYADKFRGFIRKVIAKATETNEPSASANYVPPTPEQLGEEDNTLLYVGAGVAVVAIIGLSIYLNRPKAAGAVAGLRRRRR
jgi:hypothetical protein